MAKTKENQPQTGLQIMQAPEVTDLIEKNKFDLTKAEAYAMGYAPLMNEVLKLTAIIKKLDKLKPEDAPIAKRASLDLGKICSKLEAKKKEDKAILLVETRLIDGLFNTAESTARLGQADAKEVFEYQERLEAEAKAELKSARIALLTPFETDTEFLPLDIMDEEKFQALLAKEKESFEAVKAKREQDEKDRIEAERKAEEARLAEIEAEKQRQAERDAEIAELKKQEEARIKAEQNRLAKEKENAESLVKLLLKNGFELGNNDSYIEPEYHTYSKGNYVVKYHELFLMKESDLLVSIGNVNTWIEQEQVREAELNAAKEEADRIRKELEAKQLAEENERLAKIAEQQEKEAAAKALLKAPDQEKVKAFFVEFTALQFPELQSEAGKAMAVRVNEALAIVKQVIIQDSKTLL